MEGKFPILGILGPRQSGKTTLIRHEFSDYTYVNLEDFDVRIAAQEDPRGFLSNLGDRFALDEVQHVPALLSYLQTLVDSEGDYSVLLSGSQNLLLLDTITQSLAGRIALFTLLPYSMGEYVPGGSLNDIMLSGSFPRIFENDISPEDYYPNYTTTYLERDVRAIKNVSNLGDFSRFLRLVAGRVGQEVNLNSLSIDVGVNAKTIKSWLAILEASFLIYLLPPYLNNYNKRITKSPKLYMTDTGLACFLLGITSADELQNYYNRGSLFENLIFGEVLKYFYNRGKKPNLYFFREKNGHEVDLILDHPSKPLALEIKSSATAQHKYHRNLDYLNKISDGQFETAVIYAPRITIYRTLQRPISPGEDYILICKSDKFIYVQFLYLPAIQPTLCLEILPYDLC